VDETYSIKFANSNNISHGKTTDNGGKPDLDYVFYLTGDDKPFVLLETDGDKINANNPKAASKYFVISGDSAGTRWFRNTANGNCASVIKYNSEYMVYRMNHLDSGADADWLSLYNYVPSAFKDYVNYNHEWATDARDASDVHPPYTIRTGRNIFSIGEFNRYGDKIGYYALNTTGRAMTPAPMLVPATTKIAPSCRLCLPTNIRKIGSAVGRLRQGK
jgi:hypothetical protein